MKEKLTLRNLVLAIVFVVGIVALIVSFNAGAKMTMEMMGQKASMEMRGLIFGKQYEILDGVKGEAATENLVHAKLSQFGVILLLVAPVVALVASLFLPQGVAKKLTVLAIVLVVVGVVFVCMMKGSYIRQSVKVEIKNAKELGVEVTSEEKKEMIKTMKEAMKDFKANGALIVTIVLGIVEVIGLSLSQVFSKNK